MTTTKEHFEIFKEECKKWINYYGLLQWEINFYHDETKSDNCALALWNLVAKRCDFYMYYEWDKEDLTEEYIKRVALHEVTHLLLGRLHSLAGYRFVRDAEIDESVHEIIRILEGILFRDKSK